MENAPPSRPKEPYHAYLHRYPSQNLALKLYEKNDLAQENIVGMGSITRSHIMIHSGPGSSLGCMMIAGGKRGHRRFAHMVETLLTENRQIKVALKQLR